MAIELVVRSPFRGHVHAEHITDPDLVAEYLLSHRAHVVPINRPDRPPAPTFEAIPDPEHIDIPPDQAGAELH